MTERFDTHAVRPDRLDLHDSNVGEELVSAGLCGITDLRTGRACRRPAPHLGSCEFGSLSQPQPQPQPPDTER